MSNNTTTPRYGQIVAHTNAADVSYGRFLQVCEDDPRKFDCRVVDPSTMQVVRWTEHDVADGRCIPAAVGLPVMGWGWVHEIKFAGSVGGAREFAK